MQILVQNSGVKIQKFRDERYCVMMVIASDVYDESDYIRNYAEFIEVLNK